MSSARAWRLVLPTDVTGVTRGDYQIGGREGRGPDGSPTDSAGRASHVTNDRDEATALTGPDTGNGGQMPHVHVGQRWLEQRAVDIDLLGERGEESRKALST